MREEPLCAHFTAKIQVATNFQFPFLAYIRYKDPRKTIENYMIMTETEAIPEISRFETDYSTGKWDGK